MKMVDAKWVFRVLSALHNNSRSIIPGHGVIVKVDVVHDKLFEFRCRPMVRLEYLLKYLAA